MPARVLTVGGGFGGITAALEIVKLAGDRVAVSVIDREPRFFMGLTKLWVATGRRGADECMHPRDRLSRQGAGFIFEEVRAVDPEKKEIVTGSRRIAYDRLILAPGLSIVPEAIPGLVEHGLNLYRMSGAEEVHTALQSFTGGEIVIAVCAAPYKCPPAPYEAAMLIEEFLRGRGVREKTNLTVATCDPRPLPALPPEIGAGVAALLSARGIAFLPQHKTSRVEAGRVFFENGVEKRFDLLIAVPPHRPPRFLKETPGLADENGYVLVDRQTLQTKFPDVYGIGDAAKVVSATGAMIPRAGILAEKQAQVVARNIANDVLGKTERAVFDGMGECFLETGGGRATKVVGDFFHEPSPAATLAPEPTSDDFRAKVEFEAERIRAWFGS